MRALIATIITFLAFVCHIVVMRRRWQQRYIGYMCVAVVVAILLRIFYSTEAILSVIVAVLLMIFFKCWDKDIWGETISS